MKLIKLLSATALVGSFAMVPGHAFAQATTATTVQPDDEIDPSTGKRKDKIDRDQAQAEPDAAIVVTGSRIARPASESQVPLTSITAEDLLSGGSLVVGDALEQLPQIRSTYSQANSTRFIGTSGLNLLDLRGLGISRTLVLQNGRRHITASAGDYLVDTNTIPSDLLERVDVITGGDAAIYGSDAVAGVVNFVLKRNFDGLKLTGQAGISTHGDRGAQFVSAVVGRNFADGRGNIAVAAEYAHSDPVYFRDRDFETGAFSGRSQFNLASETVSSTTNLPESALGNGIIDNQYYNGIRSGTIADSGLIQAVCNAASVANAARCRPGAQTFTISTAARGQRYVFNDAGNLVLSTPTLDFRDFTNAGSTNTQGGLGSTLRNTGQLIPLQDRLSLNALGHFDISDAFRPFFEAKYVRVHVNQEGQPSFFSPISSTLGLPNLRCDNAFLNAQALSTLVATGLCAGATAATFPFSRFNVDFGGRGEIQNRTTYRIVSGIEGTFNDDWKYEISSNYGDFRAKLRSLNNLVLTDLNGNNNGFSLAYDAALAPAGYVGSNFVLNAAGQKVVCRINADLTAANDRSDCVPLNLFGQNNEDPRALAFSQTTTRRSTHATELVFNGFVSGDFSQLFELPGGPIAFSIGGEYRRETAYEAYDKLVQVGGTFLNAIQPFLPPALSVVEGFAEVQIPLLKDLPFAEELTVTGAARISDYDTSAGTTRAYNAGVLYAPVSFLKFRANYSRSVRVPTQSDLFSTPSQNFAFLADPCDVANINTGTASRPTNCAAQGIPTGYVNTNARSASTAYLSGGNALLTPEVSDSYTVGLVFEPRAFIPGLSITVDYYSINVNNIIATLGAQTILNNCYDQPSLTNQYCQLLRPRNADFSFSSSAALLSSGVNFAREFTSGIDVDLAYNHTFGNGDKAGARFIGSWVSQRTFYTNPQNPNFADTAVGEVGDPEFEFQATLSYKHGPLSLRYNAHFLDKMTVNVTAFETLNNYQGRAATNPDAYSFKFFNTYSYHDIRAEIQINDKFSVYSGVDNVFDTLPPFGLLGNGGGDAIYDNIGRYYFGGVKASF